jgi:perosamine synthetase
MQTMLDVSVATRRGITCTHREPAYRSEDWSCDRDRAVCQCERRCDRLQESEKAQGQTILLPLFHQMTELEQERTIEVLKSSVLGLSVLPTKD